MNNSNSIQVFKSIKAETAKLPKGSRKTDFDVLLAHGQFFMCAALFLDEKRAFLMAGFDGVPMVKHERRVFLPTDWLKENVKNCASEIDFVLAAIKLSAANSQ